MPGLARVLRNLFRSDRVDREFDDELRAYVEMTADEKRSAGLSDADARRLALAELGGIEPVKERVRDVRAGVLLEQVRQDLAYAIRTLRKNVAFTTIAVATLAIGIGATTAVFSIVDTVVFRSPPYADPESLVRVCELVIRANACLDRVSLEEYEHVRRLDLFEQVAADDGMTCLQIGLDRVGGERRASGASTRVRFPARPVPRLDWSRRSRQSSYMANRFRSLRSTPLLRRHSG